MTCKNCGKEFSDGAFCPYCGTPQYTQSVYKSTDGSSVGYAILCFFFPIIGLILYLVWKDEYPLRAKSCGKGALISVIVNAVLVVLYILLIVIIIAIGVGSAGMYYGALALL